MSFDNIPQVKILKVLRETVIDRKTVFLAEVEGRAMPWAPPRFFVICCIDNNEGKLISYTYLDSHENAEMYYRRLVPRKRRGEILEALDE